MFAIYTLSTGEAAAAAAVQACRRQGAHSMPACSMQSSQPPPPPPSVLSPPPWSPSRGVSVMQSRQPMQPAKQQRASPAVAAASPKRLQDSRKQPAAAAAAAARQSKPLQGNRPVPPGRGPSTKSRRRHLASRRMRQPPLKFETRARVSGGECQEARQAHAAAGSSQTHAGAQRQEWAGKMLSTPVLESPCAGRGGELGYARGGTTQGQTWAGRRAHGKPQAAQAGRQGGASGLCRQAQGAGGERGRGGVGREGARNERASGCSLMHGRMQRRKQAGQRQRPHSATQQTFGRGG